MANKEKLNLSIDGELKKDFKHLSISSDRTCSELVEIFIKAVKNNRDVIGALEQMGEQKKKRKK